MKLGIKVDVTTRRGARIGVPQLMGLFVKHQVRATFFFALGPDRRWGRSWLPGRAISRRAISVMREARDSGFEVGISSYDPMRWMQHIDDADEHWTRKEIGRACDAFLQLMDTPAQSHAAAGWRMNRHAYRLTQRFAFRYGSDTRGICPFMPVRNAEVILCPQLPTTLAPLDEIMVDQHVALDEAVERMLRATESPPESGHIYSACAEHEGVRYASAFEKLLSGWRTQGYGAIALEDFLFDMNLARLPRHSVTAGTIPGRPHEVAIQGREFLS
jgi:undecaprenyl phosphate-alpha-L-ara4FN deformylase